MDFTIATIAGIFRVLILVIIIAALAGFKLPIITGDIQAIAAVGMLIAIKFVIGTVGYFFHWL